jgi:tetratricopeptide (TPR) repeat protein
VATLAVAYVLVSSTLLLSIFVRKYGPIIPSMVCHATMRQVRDTSVMNNRKIKAPLAAILVSCFGFLPSLAEQSSSQNIENIDNKAVAELRARHKEKAESLWRDEILRLQDAPESVKVGYDFQRTAYHFENDLNDRTAAEASYNKALSIFDREIGIEAPQSIPVLMRLGSLATWHKDKGAAERFYKRALAISEITFGPSDVRVAQVLDQLAQVYRDDKRWREALPLFQRIVIIYSRDAEASEVYSATARNKIADMLAEQGQLKNAEKPFTEAIDSYSKSMGRNSILVASLLDSLGDIYTREKNYKDAESAFKRSLAIKETSLGPHSEFLIVTLESYAKLLKATERLPQANDCTRRAENIRKLLPPATSLEEVLAPPLQDR